MVTCRDYYLTTEIIVKGDFPWSRGSFTPVKVRTKCHTYIF